MAQSDSCMIEDWKEWLKQSLVGIHQHCRAEDINLPDIWHPFTSQMCKSRRRETGGNLSGQLMKDVHAHLHNPHCYDKNWCWDEALWEPFHHHPPLSLASQVQSVTEKVDNVSIHSDHWDSPKHPNMCKLTNCGRKHPHRSISPSHRWVGSGWQSHARH